MTQHDALGLAGGARGVEDAGDGLGRGTSAAALRHRVLGDEFRRAPTAGRCPVSQHHNLAQRRQRRQTRQRVQVVVRAELRLDDQDMCIGVREDLAELARGDERRDRHQRRTSAPHAERHRQPLRTVARQQRHVRTRSVAGAAQAGRPLVRGTVERRKAHCSLLADNRQAARRAGWQGRREGRSGCSL